MKPNRPANKWERLYRGQQCLDSFQQIQIFDKLEPILDLTQAKKYLSKFMLKC